MDKPSSVTIVDESINHLEKPHPAMPSNLETCDSSKSSNLEPPSNLRLLSSENLELLKFLGKGAFGEVSMFMAKYYC